MLPPQYDFGLVQFVGFTWHCHGQECCRASTPPTMRVETCGWAAGMPQFATTTSTDRCIAGATWVVVEISQFKNGA